MIPASSRVAKGVQRDVQTSKLSKLETTLINTAHTVREMKLPRAQNKNNHENTVPNGLPESGLVQGSSAPLYSFGSVEVGQLIGCFGARVEALSRQQGAISRPYQLITAPLVCPRQPMRNL